MYLEWSDFPWFGIFSVFCWLLASWMAYRPVNRKWVIAIGGSGCLFFLFFIAGLGAALERPPMRTLGETRLFYSLFVALTGWVIYIKYRYAWILTCCTLLAAVFVGLNLLKPEVHDKALMPVLQSFWFVPHVIVYMLAYAMLGGAFLIMLYDRLIKKGKRLEKWWEVADNLVYIGVAFLTLGMLFGALWAQEAWGHYWGWDPKETWAAITWFSYLGYIHLRYRYPASRKLAAIIGSIAFVFLQICWYGIDFLPAAAHSVHTYTRM